jgi:hypothetical protein
MDNNFPENPMSNPSPEQPTQGGGIGETIAGVQLSPSIKQSIQITGGKSGDKIMFVGIGTIKGANTVDVEQLGMKPYGAKKPNEMDDDELDQTIQSNAYPKQG